VANLTGRSASYTERPVILWNWMVPARSRHLMEKSQLLTPNSLLNQKISSVRARDKIHSRVPQTQRSASSRGLAIGIAMAF
jgi:hypothetical protein